ncbi:M23 family metallopeptidase [Rubrivivax sp. A210]|uniref:M23 family metallopeptidase n=1 Tax=Rubrivivax sp. A210 TaxID=2772301 RepID=UPI001F2AEEDD|nr:M23 family metallopeptidase [Rubrivivax sp. A210]
MMIAAGQGARVRTLATRHLAAAAGVAALLLLGAGASLGYWLAPRGGSEAPLPLDASARHFTLEQLGALSGRLFKLESQASQLGQRIGLMPAPETPAKAAPVQAPQPAVASSPAAGSGGPLLPPKPLPGLDELGALDEQLARLDRHLAAVSSAVALRASDLLRLPTRWPVEGVEIVSPFGNRRDPFTEAHAFHAGVDFAAPPGTPILAAAGGRVVVAGPRPEFGLTVEIEHGNGLRTRYAHAMALLVGVGDVVGQGEAIARVGSSGRSTGPHLHFEVLRNDAAVDPRRWLAQRP